MASYHLSVKTVSRAATAAAAYRAAERIRDERTGALHDYTRKRGVEHRELVLPADAPAWARDRGELWNHAEAAERRKNSTVAREFEIALPAELSAAQRKELAMGFARDLVARHGFAVDLAIHAPHREGDHRNHHAHLLCSTRRLTAEGFMDKTRELDDQRSGEIPRWRERWADLQNHWLKAHEHLARVDHRTLEEQGLDREPGHHRGPAIAALERRWERSEVAEHWREEDRAEAQARLERAAELGRLEREAAQLNLFILDLSGDIAAARLERDTKVARESAKQTRLQAVEWWKQQRAEQEHIRSAERDHGKSPDGPDDGLTR